MTPQTKKSIGVMSGDRGGNSMGPRLPIHLSGNVSSSKFRTAVAVFSAVFSEVFINIKVLFLLLQINIVIQYLTVLLIYYRVSV